MKKTLFLVLAGIVVFAVTGFFIITRRPKQPSEKSVTLEKKDEIIQKEKESPKEKIGEILSRGKSISTVKYEMVVNQSGQPSIVQKVWLKKDRMKTEMTTSGQTTIMFANLAEGVIYQYLPSQNIAMKMQSDKALESLESPVESIKDIEKYQTTIVGTESIDGKDCLVVEYNIGEIKMKSWIWKEKGFPVKMETNTPSGTVTTEFKNIEFVDIPDSIFELPAGVKVIAP